VHVRVLTAGCKRPAGLSTLGRRPARPTPAAPAPSRPRPWPLSAPASSTSLDPLIFMSSLQAGSESGSADAADAGEEGPDADGGDVSGGGSGGARGGASRASYDYLLSMALWSLTYEKVAALQEDADAASAEVRGATLGMGFGFRRRGYGGMAGTGKGRTLLARAGVVRHLHITLEAAAPHSLRCYAAAVPLPWCISCQPAPMPAAPSHATSAPVPPQSYHSTLHEMHMIHDMSSPLLAQIPTASVPNRLSPQPPLGVAPQRGGHPPDV
jgi:hypothetical protein